MHIQAILKILGFLLILFSSTMLPPLAISLYYQDSLFLPFACAMSLTLFPGLLIWLPVKNSRQSLRFRDGFLIVVLFWVVLAVVGAVPLALAEHPSLTLIDALFESMSGLTTTGASIITGLDQLPRSILYYRQQLQWLGGMGIIVLAVAVMPMLGVGGMQLYRAETPGPVKDNKLTPRITETAKALWYIYLGLTVICAIAYFYAGMTLFDAICHSFATVAIGGFSTHDASMGHFDSGLVSVIAIVFMLLSGLNYGLHFAALRSKTIALYIRDPEAMVYLWLIVVIFLLCLLILIQSDTYATLDETVLNGLFHVVSISTTTGFTTTGFAWWPGFLPVLLILMSAVGGCAGSTAGGMKVIRAILLYKQGMREISKLVHPNALIPIKLGGKPVADNVINAVWGFMSLYILCYVILSVLMVASGSDLVTAFSAVTACLNNMGPGLGEVSQDYTSVSTQGKMILTFTMLLGRLELFTLLVLISPVFWKS